MLPPCLRLEFSTKSPFVKQSQVTQGARGCAEEDEDASMPARAHMDEAGYLNRWRASMTEIWRAVSPALR